MRILPVLDLQHGQVVRGVAGKRAEYQPIVSRLCDSAAPFAVAVAFRERFGLADLYLADLDAIAGQPAALPLYSSLLQAGFSLWVDAGIRMPDDAQPLIDLGVGVIVGLETIHDPECLREVCRRTERAVFSLDLRDGQPLATWGTADPLAIAAAAVAAGARRILVLDLARVGVGSGTGSQALCAQLRLRHPGIELWAGGGIRGQADLRQLRADGIQVALVASALHDGRLTRKDLSDETLLSVERQLA
jgi:phosphoribosylformimino-5-aminoimidazole carboxamide ribotide isomerase